MSSSRTSEKQQEGKVTGADPSLQQRAKDEVTVAKAASSATASVSKATPKSSPILSKAAAEPKAPIAKAAAAKATAPKAPAAEKSAMATNEQTAAAPKDASSSASVPFSQSKIGSLLAQAAPAAAAAVASMSKAASASSTPKAPSTGTVQSATPAAAAKAPAKASPTSAAAVFGTTPAPATANERLQTTGSALARGSGAKAEAAQPKAQAKPKAAAPGYPSAMPKSTSVPVVASSTAASVPVPVPDKVLDIISRKPEYATEEPSSYTAPAPVGPARAYAAKAAGAIAQINGTSAIRAGAPSAPSQVPVSSSSAVPKAGPAAVAVGRAVASGAQPSPAKAPGGKPTAPISKRYQIVFVTSELAPYSKTGGLGEAMDGLPVALAAMGHRVMVISPRYDQYKDAWDTSFWSSVTVGGKQEDVHFFHCYKQKVDQVFVDHPSFMERVAGLTGSKLYGPEWGYDFADNQARYAYFCKAALIAIQDLPLAGYPYGDKSIVIANDWHSALVPMFIDVERQQQPERWSSVKTAFLCHNAVFQGRFALEENLAEIFDVPQKYIDSITFQMPVNIGKENEKVACINSMAAALIYADQAITVSPTYAIECATDEEKGCELETLFAKSKVVGIVNGVKEGVSASDPMFVKKTMINCGTFTMANVDAAKDAMKAEYRATSGLPTSKCPLMCFVGRLDLQKGYDLMLEALMDVLQDTEMQVVVVGSGRADLVALTKAMQQKFPTKFYYAGWMGPERYALVGGCDFTLLPSRWEPCGLVQMEAMRLGTLPVVAPTGGLKDTVQDGVTGLWTDQVMDVMSDIDMPSVESLAKALRQASQLYTEDPAAISKMRKAAMAASDEFTWSNAALQYESLFEELGASDVLASSENRTVTLEADTQVC